MTPRKNERIGPLPGAIGLSVAASSVRGGVDVGNSRILLVGEQQYIFLNHFPVWLMCHGIVRNLADVSGRSQVIQRLGSFLLVESVFPNGLTQRRKIGVHRSLPGRKNGAAVRRNRNA